VVEEKRLGMSSGIVHCPGDKRRVDHFDAAQDSDLSAHGVGSAFDGMVRYAP
jgi:hypothetical protein